MEFEYHDDDIDDVPEELIDYHKRWRYFTKCENYIISDDGRIWSYYINKLLSMHTSACGYYMISLYRKTYSVHILTYCAYNNNYDKLLVIDHIDGNKVNNNIDNLQLITRKENSQKKTKNYDVEVTRVCSMSEIKYKTIEDAILDTPGASRRCIVNACAGRRQTYLGYIWIYTTKDIKKIESGIDDHKYKLLGEINGMDFNNYQINENGVIRKIMKDRRIVLKQTITSGYYCVHVNGETLFIHRLVAELYCLESKTPERKCVNHLNKKKLDNRASNLEWCTLSENSIHSHGRKVVSINMETREIEKEFNSITEANLCMGAPKSSGLISKVCKNKARSAYGKYWKYIS